MSSGQAVVAGLGWPTATDGLTRATPADHRQATGLGWPEVTQGGARVSAPTDEVSGEPTAERADVSRETSTERGGVSRETQGGDVAAHAAGEAEEDDTPIARAAAAAVRVLGRQTGLELLPLPPHPRIMTVANQKGGVGKTTTVVNLAAALALHGARVLVVDLDPQANASTALGIDRGAALPSVYDVLIRGRPFQEAVRRVVDVPNLACVPATIDLAGAEIELVPLDERESRLRGALGGYADLPHYVLIDCPPSLGLLTVNALVAATEVLVPIQCEYYALEGVGQLLQNVELVRAELNPALRVSTVLLTMYDARTRLAAQVADDVRAHFGDRVLRTAVPRSVRVSEAPSFGQTVITYDPGSPGALSYLEAAREIAVMGACAGSADADARRGAARAPAGRSHGTVAASGEATGPDPRGQR